MNDDINDKYFQVFPKLETDRLHLRPFSTNDAHDLFVLRSNEKVMEYMDTQALKSDDEALKMIQKIQHSFKEKSGIDWVITEKGSDLLIGYTGFWKIDRLHKRGELGYTLMPQYWRNGYMNEALQSILNFAFIKLNIHSIEANVNENNSASIGLLEKLGFEKEAHFKENYFFNGRFLDSVIYSLLEKNFKRFS